MKNSAIGKNFYPSMLFTFLFSLLLVFFVLPANGPVCAYNSDAWKERITQRTGVLLIDGQAFVDGIVLNARGELSVTWLERGLNSVLTSDRNVDEWVIDGLGYYYSSRKETKAKIKGRDVFSLKYRAFKYWNFDPSKLIINGKAAEAENILTRKEYWESDLAPGQTGMVAIAIPSVKPGSVIELRYEDAAVKLETPGRAK